jgi:hypothetical protein
MTTELAVSSQLHTSPRTLTNNELGEHVEQIALVVGQTLADLKPFIEELWRRFDQLEGRETIRGCHTKKEFCEKVLGKTARAVQYMLAGGNSHDYRNNTSGETRNHFVSDTETTAVTDARIDWTTKFKVGDVAAIENFFGRTENPSYRLGEVNKVTPSYVTCAELKFGVNGVSALNRLYIGDIATKNQLKTFSYREWRFPDGRVDKKMNMVCEGFDAVKAIPKKKLSVAELHTWFKRRYAAVTLSGKSGLYDLTLNNLTQHQVKIIGQFLGDTGAK